MSNCSAAGCRQIVNRVGEYCPLHVFQCKNCDIRLSKQNSLCIYCLNTSRPKFNTQSDLYLAQIEKFVEEEALKHLEPKEK